MSRPSSVMTPKEKTFNQAFALLQSTHPDSTAQLQQLLSSDVAKNLIDGACTFQGDKSRFIDLCSFF